MGKAKPKSNVQYKSKKSSTHHNAGHSSHSTHARNHEGGSKYTDSNFRVPVEDGNADPASEPETRVVKLAMWVRTNHFLAVCCIVLELWSL